MTRTEVFQNLNLGAADGRKFVALLQAMGTSPDGKPVISSCMYFFGPSAEDAAKQVDDFLFAEIEKAARAEARVEEMAKRRKA